MKRGREERTKRYPKLTIVQVTSCDIPGIVSRRTIARRMRTTWMSQAPVRGEGKKRESRARGEREESELVLCSRGRDWRGRPGSSL